MSSPTRRQLLASGAAAAGAAAVALPLARPAGALAQAHRDAAVLAGLIEIEQIAAFAYETAGKAGSLAAPTRELLALLATQERAHADRLAKFHEELGGKRPARPKSVADVDPIVPGLGAATAESALLEFALELETAIVGRYYEAHKQLESARLLQAATAIMGSEGQHLAALRRAIGRAPLATAFESGER